MPSTNLSAVGQANYAVAYEAVANVPLFNANNDTAPSTSNINQGYLGDCYFLSAIGEIALQDPTTIENMISENANGTYSVEFQINGKADYVTVNDELPEVPNGTAWYPGTNLYFDNGNGALWSRWSRRRSRSSTSSPASRRANSASITTPTRTSPAAGGRG